jgi:hypothetical protein
VIGLLCVAVLPYDGSAQILDNPFSEYFERGITITPEGGNAKDANAAIHTIDPWPPYAGNTRISQDGRGAVNAVERMYKNCQIFPLAQSISTIPGGGAVAGNAGGCEPAPGPFGGAGAWSTGGGGGGGGGGGASGGR